MFRRTLAVVASAALLVSACVGAAPPASPSAPPTATPTPTRPPITLAGQAMEWCIIDSIPAVCGTLRVPEDRTNPGGRWIDLRVAVVPAEDTIPAPDAFVPLDGGPGQAATEDLGWTARAFSDFHRTHDFVFVDQRGTGGSNRLVVPESPDMTGLSEAEATLRAQVWIKEVLAAMPGDPRFYTTSVAMDDLDDVRAALGYEKLDLYGPSYGATQAQYYLRQHGEHVRAIVLDGGTLLDVPIFERVATNSQAALDVMFSRCAADVACRTAFPHVKAEFQAVLARLATGSVTTTVAHPWTGKPLVIDSMTFVSAVHSALMRADITAALPSLIHAAYLGAWDRIGQVVAGALGPKALDTSVLAMSIVIRCSEAWARYDPVEVARLGTGSYERDLQIAGAEQQAIVCSFTPKGVVPPNDAEPARSNVPVLLILGEADPQDPLANVADAPAELPNSLTLVVPGAGHMVGASGCMSSIVTAFLDRGSVADLDVSCMAAGNALPPFSIP